MAKTKTEPEKQIEIGIKKLIREEVENNKIGRASCRERV